MTEDMDGWHPYKTVYRKQGGKVELVNQFGCWVARLTTPHGIVEGSRSSSRKEALASLRQEAGRTAELFPRMADELTPLIQRLDNEELH